MAYQALYRKWRPDSFRTMVGQEHIKRTLENQIMQNHIAHAYLFCGSRGTGKTSTAKIMARAINCEQPINGDACGVCNTCVALSAQTDLDILEIDAASNNGVDEIRDLRDKVKYPPQYGRYKVYIIDEVHMLSTAAFNALLKTLEEPPEHVVFILATTEPQKLPATVLSRCQRFDFGRFTAQELAGRLKEAADGAEVKVTDEALMMIARAAEGGMRDALSILDICISYENNIDGDVVRRVLGTADKAFLFSFSKALQEESLKDIMQLIDRLMRDGKEPQVFLKDLSRHVRALLLAKTAKGDLENLLEMTREDAKEYEDQADGFDVGRLIRFLEIFAQAEGEMRYAASPRIALEVACIKACSRTKEGDASSLQDRVQDLENEINRLQKKLESGQFQKAAARSMEERPAAAVAPKQLPSMAGESDTKIWEEAKKELRKNNPSMYANLAKGRFMGVNGNVYRYEIPRADDIFLNILNKESNRTGFSKILSQLSGKEVLFEAYVEQDLVGRDEKRREQNSIDQLTETFGKEKVQVRDE